MRLAVAGPVVGAGILKRAFSKARPSRPQRSARPVAGAAAAPARAAAAAWQWRWHSVDSELHWHYALTREVPTAPSKKAQRRPTVANFTTTVRHRDSRQACYYYYYCCD